MPIRSLVLVKRVYGETPKGAWREGLMSDQVWYVYQSGQQLGPFAAMQIRQMIDSKMIPQDAYLFKVGWKDWRPIEETFEDLGVAGATRTTKSSDERRSTAPRATIAGRVIVHNDGQLIIGSGVNISSSGIFVETRDQMFNVGERLKLSVRVDGFSRAFNAIAQVVRFNSDPRFPVGYGLRFEGLEAEIAREIQSAVDRANVRRQASDQRAQ
jgi:hypothetical protein